MNKSITIVTAFFNIGRDKWLHGFQRSAKDYLLYFKNLASLDNEMIIFTSKEYIPIIQKYRKNRPTHIIEIDFQKKLKYTIQKVQTILDSDKYQQLIPSHLLKNPEYHCAEYVVVTNLKFYFMKKAVETVCKMHRDSHLFAWIDFGFCRTNSTTNGIKNWYHNFDPNFIHLLTLKDPFIIEDKETMLQKALHNEGIIIGGMMIGSKTSWERLYPLITQLQSFYLKKNISDDDQGTILMMLCERPDLFIVHKSKNGWFSGFKQFNKGSLYKNLFYKIKSMIKN
ncbi:WlaTC/HtrL family glycosyltransferase [Ignatzschineria cameli]|uniref:WlaTC/HtrL family glycosyltransferase n=1 Tax=Ignatzschineria cameli TaxID=2182793 RepID=UPI000D60DA3A|nr:WlaTC/HtrL family glycosyltransferase [Ignatzschineria cameli]PWD85342.1 hypothetical protein DC080_06710 [Ignatzschineria cameli]